MLSHHTAKFGDHRHRGNRVMICLVAEEQDSTCPSLNRHYYI